MFKHFVLSLFSGTNLQALIDSTTGVNNNCSSEIVLVISNKAGIQGLERAQKAGIQTQVRHCFKALFLLVFPLITVFSILKSHICSIPIPSG